MVVAAICGLLIVTGFLTILEREKLLWDRTPVTTVISKKTLTAAEMAADPTPRYQVDIIHEGKKQTVDLDSLGDDRGVNDVRNRIRVGQMQHKAYAEPGNIKSIMYAAPIGMLQYFIILVPLPLLVGSIYVLIFMDEEQHRRLDIPAPSGALFDVQPKRPVWFRLAGFAVLAVVWNGVAIPTCLDYIFHEPADTKIGGYVLLIFYSVVGLLLLGFTLTYLLNDLRVKKAEVKVSRMPLAIGMPVDVQTEQIFSRSVRLAAVRLGLVCSKIESLKYDLLGMKVELGFKKTVVTEIWREVLVSKQVRGGQSLTLDHNFTVPTDGRSTTKPEIEKGPWHCWHIELHLTFVDGPDYYRHFPVLAGHDKQAPKQGKLPSKPPGTPVAPGRQT